MEEKFQKFARIFSSLPPVLIRRTLNLDGDIKRAHQRLQKFQAMENPMDTLQTSVGGNVPSGTRQEKSSKAAHFRGNKKSGRYRFVNHNEIPKKQGEVKELRNLTTDSFDDYTLGQNNDYESNQGQDTRPSGVFSGRPRGVPREGPRGGFVQGQSSNQGFKENNKGESQGTGIGCGNLAGRGLPPKPNARSWDRSYRRRSSSFQTTWDSGIRGRGQRRTSFPSFTAIEDQPCQAGAIEQSRFQQNQLLVRGLSELTTDVCLVNFIEAMSGGEVVEVIRRDDEALITMANDITGKSN